MPRKRSSLSRHYRTTSYKGMEFIHINQLLYNLYDIIELEEKDDDHLKCPEDTTSIGSNSVRWVFIVYFIVSLL